ncbi:MAG: hypothetical protein K1X89_03345 [Myxococcaceae bacterium]|nr:hypothetical protein [Myxococcaceae bacterium]
MRLSFVVAVLWLGAGCALLKGERRAPPPRANAPALDAYREAAVLALQEANRMWAVVQTDTHVVDSYFADAEWRTQKGLLASSRQATVVFITQDKDGCQWSQWTFAQKSLGDDGWAKPVLMPGPEDTDSISCAVLEQSGGVYAPAAAAGRGAPAASPSRASEPPPQPPGGLGPPKEAAFVIISCSQGKLVAALQNKRTAQRGEHLALQTWNGSAWQRWLTATVASVQGGKVELDAERPECPAQVPGRLRVE